MKRINYIFTLALTSLTSLAMAQGETCASALAITPGTYNANGPATGGGCNDCTDSANADWYSYTANAAGLLSISSCGGGVDTRLFVYDGACGSLNPIATSDDVCDLGDGNLYASELTNIQVCAGTTYYMEWDDRWDTLGFAFTLSFTPANTNDLAFQTGSEYTMLPSSAALVKANGTFTNVGLGDITNAAVNVSVTKNGTSFTPDFSIASPSILATNFCASGANTADVTSDWLNLSASGTYQLVYNSSAMGSDPFLGNNVDTTVFIVDTTFARDNGEALGALSIGDGTGGLLGQNFTLLNADAMSSVYFELVAPITGTTTHAVVYSVDASGTPVAEIGRTIDYTTTADDEANGLAITLPIATSNIALTAGQEFFVGIEETTDAITLRTTTGIYTPRKNWVYYNSAWQNGEDFNFAPTYVLRPNFGTSAAFVNTTSIAQSLEGLSISPNPSQGDINVSFALSNTSDIRINVMDMTGKILISSNSSANAGRYIQTLNLGNLTAGLYTVQVITNEGNATQRVVVTK